MAQKPPTQLEKDFIREYLVDCNATRAYGRVKPGSSYNTCRTEGSRLLARPYVSKKIKQRQKTIADRAGVTEEAIVRELTHMAFARQDDYITVDKSGKIIIDLKDMTSEQSAAISGIKTKKYWDKYNDAEVTEVELKHHDKNRPLEMLGKYLGVRGFGTNKLELTGKNGGPVLVGDVTKMNKAQLEAIVAAGPNAPDEEEENNDEDDD
jgi:phage terminase small subunit